MAWNEPGNDGEKGKGDKGDKGNDPWRNQRGKKNEDVDLEAAIEDLKNKFKALFGFKTGGKKPSDTQGSGSSSGGSGILMIIGVLALAWAVIDSSHIIGAREKAVVLRFGKFNRVLDPGLRLTLPRPFETVTRVDVTQVRTTSATVTMLTKDENMVDVDFAVQYTVSNPFDFSFRVQDPEETLTQVAEAALRQVVGSRTLDEVLVGSRADISTQTQKIMQDVLGVQDEKALGYRAGISVASVNLQDATVPKEVKDAFDDAIRAREDEQKFVNQALAEKSKLVPNAEGAASRLTREAEAYRDVLIAKATGDARRFEQLAKQYRAAPAVTRQRLYLETMEGIYRNTPKVVMDKQGGSNMMYLPLDKMMEQKQRAASAAAAEGNSP